jgi:hypothetical protein
LGTGVLAITRGAIIGCGSGAGGPLWPQVSSAQGE